MTYLDAFLRFLNTEEYSNRQNIAIVVSDIFEKTPDMTFEDFCKQIHSINTDFFRINKLKRDEFSERVFQILLCQKKFEQSKEPYFAVASKFI